MVYIATFDESSTVLWQFIIVACVFLALSAGAVFLRVLAARLRKRALKLHDYLIFGSLLFMVAFLALVVGPIGFLLGRGRYPDPVYPDGDWWWSITEEDVIAINKANFANTYMWYTSSALFRLAILDLYREIFRTTLFRRYALYSAVVVLLFWAVQTLTSLLYCRPLALNWDMNGHCGRAAVIFEDIFPIVSGIVIDTWVAFLPFPLIWRLRLNLVKKIGVLTTFALGVVIAGVNLARLVNKAVGYVDETKVTNGRWVRELLLASAEMSGGIIVACVPVLGVLFFPKQKAPVPAKRDPDVPETIGSKPVKLKMGDVTLIDSVFRESSDATELA